MTFKELRVQTGMTQKAFAEYFGIPVRTVQDWEAGISECKSYIIKLLEYRLSEHRVYLIYCDDMDDACEIIGYTETAEEAEKICDKLNADPKRIRTVYYERIDQIKRLT